MNIENHRLCRWYRILTNPPLPAGLSAVWGSAFGTACIPVGTVLSALLFQLSFECPKELLVQHILHIAH